ncbi:DUF3239 domain-containing protein [Haloferula sp. BvORR071]|uniref:DUF3239 domain-containing protein n=1 Tax=Haloferula sp. BvORR071 TaxID=1396141 RepID=UPI002240F60A|nr:DUF3239 domain-containing protein [Haloferula sp. BvORR071]
MDTYATLPGELEISRWRYRAYFASWRMWLLSFLPDSAGQWPLVGRDVKIWVRYRKLLQVGDLLPAIVYNRETGLVAAYTNLQCSGNRPWPVIKIFRDRLSMLPNLQHRQQLAVVAFYGGSEESRAEGHWDNIHPIVVDCLVSDREARARTLERISKTSWQALEAGLKMLPPSPGEGIYHVKVPDELAWEA